ncbi:MAG: SMC-Scp complex subunit ScpB [Propionibacteriaceae bacterium]|jgi:segregation and condensation protein B|nr:SMC-Scp complex subunit ScpB [Propionibacteriaceae bacterium]
MTDTPWVESAIEALLILATEPLTETELAATLDAPVGDIKIALQRLARWYDETGRGFELRHIGDGWRYYTRPEHSETIARSILEGQHGKLSQAAMETLAVIAYLQPISRSRIAAVRGVNVDTVVRTLISRNLVCEVSRDETSGAGLLGTTTYFLERMGLTSLDELPPLAPNLPEATQLEEELRRATVEEVSRDQAPLPIGKQSTLAEPTLPEAEEIPDGT